MFQFQISNIFAEQFGWNFIFLYAFREGLEPLRIGVYFLLEFASCALFIVLVRRLELLRSMRVGLLLRMAAFALVLRIVWEGQFYIAGVLLGAFVTLFWIPYNTRFIELTCDTDRAQSSATLFALFAVLGATLPLAAGFLWAYFNFQLVLLACIGALALGLALSYRLGPCGTLAIDLAAMLGKTRGLLPLLLCEGLWQGVFWLGVPLGLILSLLGPGQYGAFYSFLGLLGGISSILAGRWSDRKGSRGPLVVASALAGGTFSLAAAFSVGNLAAWTTALGLVYFSSYILFPFTFTVVAERSSGPAEAMTVRELVTNLGRVAGGLAVIFSLLLAGGLAPAFALGGLALFGLAASYLSIKK